MTKQGAAYLGRKRWMTQGRREALYGFLFALPGILGFLLWTAGPTAASLYYSVTEFYFGVSPRFVGLQNYTTALTVDPLFWGSLGRTLRYVVMTVPVGTVGSLLLASALNQRLPGTKLMRALFYIPSLIPIVAMAVMWKWLLEPRIGPINYFLRHALHIQPPISWLGTTKWVIPALVVMSLWGTIGGNRMMIFLAGLQGVPQELYDSAEVDGANAWHRLRHITLPMISPTLFFNLVLGMIGALKVFTVAYVTTGGGPARASWFFALHIYQQAFRYFNMGYGAALAWIFFVLVMIFTVVQFSMSRRWVFYAGEVE